MFVVAIDYMHNISNNSQKGNRPNSLLFKSNVPFARLLRECLFAFRKVKSSTYVANLRRLAKGKSIYILERYEKK